MAFSGGATTPLMLANLGAGMALHMREAPKGKERLPRRLVAAVVLGRLVLCPLATLGVLAAGTGIGGLSLLRDQPLHSALYMTNRVGAAVADTATASLVASSSPDREARSRNLALLTSTRAAARVASPLVSSKMFEVSCRGGRTPGALPFVTAAVLAIAVAPLPLLLLREEVAPRMPAT